ncbi:DUF4265 domain-containing protein [Pedobacter sp. MC2016-14]|uniref:DUF4265 domain-containing protein n=1 Tax=Pedobacter sp. MC2016-14 TaxID=2897327 RepID=UPI001E30941A|nr:DUF4265 domain-containing protein [Pedobacter sp. MC2016-14]MCD0487665.1 DUF4265 domain-containing protein [Pedobacter sp. MC2016-14]
MEKRLLVLYLAIGTTIFTMARNCRMGWDQQPTITERAFIMVRWVDEDDEGELFFDSLIEASGHSTLQIIFFKPDFVDRVTNDLMKFNCDWEGSHVREYISVDIPKIVVYVDARKYLDQKRVEGVLDFKEACLSDDHR